MRLKGCGVALLCSLGMVLQGCGAGADAAKEQQTEWQWLFDGSSVDAWMQADGRPLQSPWEIVDDALVLTAPGGGDILTRAKFGDFELELE